MLKTSNFQQLAIGCRKLLFEGRRLRCDRLQALIVVELAVRILRLGHAVCDQNEAIPRPQVDMVALIDGI